MCEKNPAQLRYVSGNNLQIWNQLNFTRKNILPFTLETGMLIEYTICAKCLHILTLSTGAGTNLKHTNARIQIVQPLLLLNTLSPAQKDRHRSHNIFRRISWVKSWHLNANEIEVRYLLSSWQYATSFAGHKLNESMYWFRDRGHIVLQNFRYRAMLMIF